MGVYLITLHTEYDPIRFKPTNFYLSIYYNITILKIYLNHVYSIYILLIHGGKLVGGCVEPIPADIGHEVGSNLYVFRLWKEAGVPRELMPVVNPIIPVSSKKASSMENTFVK